MPTGDAPPSPKHLAWSIEGRARNQKISVQLYRLLKTHKAAIKKEQLAIEAQDLVSIAFSLWRAVFLADRTGQTEAKLTDAEAFIAKILTDNAISFAQDRKAENGHLIII